jgi:transcriptional regulator with XRE-family HTH domain
MKAEAFGVRLRRLRTEHGYSLAGLARQVLVTEAAIRNLETGDSKGPSFVVGVRLAGRIHELERRMNAFEQLHLEERHRRENP